MSSLSEEFIEQVRNSVDIVDLVSEYVVLKKAGKNYKGLCPFHQEKTPSFFVNPDNQLYYCFGCGAGGNIINFLMEIERMTFRETMKMLADRAGMTIPKNNSYYQHKQNKVRDKIFALNNLTAKFYHYLLTEKTVGKKAAAYLEKRGFDQKDINNFYLGYAPDSWQPLYDFLTERDYQVEDILKAGLIVKGNNDSYYDRFRGRIIFPIYNNRGEVLAFGGRIIDDNKKAPKYLNSPETLIYKKGKNLYGLNWARSQMRKRNEVVIMEGYTDVLTAHKAGLTHTVASLGTALTIEQAKLVKRYTDTAYIAYDADTAGARATIRGLDILKEAGLKVKIISLPDALDPDDYIKTHGKDKFVDLQEKAKSLIEFKIDRTAADVDYKNVEKKIQLARKMIEILADIEDDIERNLYLNEISERFELEKDLLIQGVEDTLNKKYSKKKDKNKNNRYTKKDNKTKHSSNINKVENLILKLYLNHPEYRTEIIKYVKPDYYTEKNKIIAEIIQKTPDISIQKLIDSIEEEDTKKRLISLSVKQEKLFSRRETIVKKFITNLKTLIYQKLKNKKNIKIEKINRLLIYFVQLSVD